jgi:hypothetical protein
MPTVSLNSEEIRLLDEALRKLATHFYSLSGSAPLTKHRNHWCEQMVQVRKLRDRLNIQK